MAELFDIGIFSVEDTDGSVGVGWKLTFYRTGTTTKQDTYPTEADAIAGTNANANPVVTDAGGRFPAIWLADTGYDYKAILSTDADVAVTTRDPVFQGLSDSDGSSRVGFIQSGSGAVARTAQDKLRDAVDVKDFGAAVDGTTDDAAAINAALTAHPYVKVSTGGTVGIATPITIPDGKILILENATIKALSGFTGSAMIKSEDFDSLTGTNTWYSSGGVPDGFGVMGVGYIDGNDQSCKGIEFYGKRIQLGYLNIHNCPLGGYYSECAYVGGQQSFHDMPESPGGVLWVRECAAASGAAAVEIRGPHDQKIASIFARGDDLMPPGTYGLKIVEDGTNYSGVIDLDNVHIYGFDTNVSINTSAKIGLLITENALGIGCTIDAGTYNPRILIDRFEAYTNARTTSTPTLQITGFGAQINQVLIRDSSDGGGIKMSGSYHQIGQAIILSNGSNHTKIALEMDACNYCSVSAFIEGFSGTGGTAFKDGTNTANYDCHVDLRIHNCATAWNHVNQGAGNFYKLSGNLSSGQTLHTGNRPVANNERADVSFRVNGTNILSRIAASAGTVDLTSTTEQSFTVTHNLYAQPYISNCRAMITGTTALTGLKVDYIQCYSTSSTQVVFKLKIGTALGSGTASLNYIAEV